MLFLNTITIDLLLGFILFATVFYFYMTRKFNHWKQKHVPYVEPIPVFGNILDICLWKCSIGDFCKSVYEKTKEPFIGFFILDEPCLLVNDLDLIKNILVKDFDHFVDRSMTNNEKNDPIGSNILFLMKSPIWRNVRRKMTPAFSSGKMKLVFALMKENAEQMMDFMENSLKKNKIIDTKTICSKFTVNTITATTFGLQANCFNDENAQFRSIALRIYNWQMIWHAIQTSCFFIAPKIVRLFNMRFLDETSSVFFKQVCSKTMKYREDTQVHRNDLMDILIHMKIQDKIDGIESFDENILVAQAAQFFIAGYETTSSTMTFTLMELARNPDVQKKLRSEILSISEKHGSFSYECLQAMHYLEYTILETLRKFPILPFLDRRCSKEYRLPGTNTILKAGDMLYIPTMGIHYDEKYYPDPHLFNPDRFNKENCEKRHKMAYLPFGEGPRNCIGRRFAILNAKCGLAHLLSKFEVKFCDKTEVRLNPKGFLVQPERGMYLEFVHLS